jgi:hypothetical protein
MRPSAPTPGRALWAIEAAGQAPPLFQIVEYSYVVTLFKTTDFGAMSKDDRVRACYQHAVIRHLNGEPMNNSSLRSRLGLRDTQASQASNVSRTPSRQSCPSRLIPTKVTAVRSTFLIGPRLFVGFATHRRNSNENKQILFCRSGNHSARIASSGA